MTFQTVGSVFHNIVLLNKFLMLDSDFLGVRIFILFDHEKSMSTTAGVSIIKACLNNFNNEA